MNRNAIFAGPGAVVAGGAVAVGLAIAGVAIWGLLDRDQAVTTAPDTAPLAVPADRAATTIPDAAPPDTASPDAANPDAANPDAASPDAASPVTVPAPVPTATPDTPIDPAPRLPEFALVRVEPDGFTQVAGIAEPGRVVDLLLDEAMVGQATAGPDGSFAALLDLPPSDAPRLMRLRMAVDGAEVTSTQEVIIAPSPTPADRPAPQAQAAGEPQAVDAQERQAAIDPAQLAATRGQPASGQMATAPSDAGAQADDSATPMPQATPGAAAKVSSAAQPGAGADVAASEPDPAPAGTSQTAQSAQAATATETVTKRAQQTVQPGGAPSVTPATGRAPGTAPKPAAAPLPAPPTVLLSDSQGVRVIQPGSAPQIMDSVAIDAITYSDSGEVELAGRSPAQGFVRIYLDNAPVTTSPVAPDGSWQSDLPQVDSGIYTLRVDQVDAQGTVVSRVETPFKREEPAALAAANAAPATAARAITVQPGYTLWAIARDRYGEGTRYVEVFNANRDRIRDPDLIYPGQVFDLPGDQ